MSKKKLLVAGILSLSIITPFSVGLAKTIGFSTYENTSRTMRNEMQIRRNETQSQQMDNMENGEMSAITILGDGQDSTIESSASEEIIKIDKDGRRWKKDENGLWEVIDSRPPDSFIGEDGFTYLNPTNGNLDLLIAEGKCEPSARNSLHGVMNCFRGEGTGILNEDVILWDQSEEHLRNVFARFPELENYMTPEEAESMPAEFQNHRILQDRLRNIISSEEFKNLPENASSFPDSLINEFSTMVEDVPNENIKNEILFASFEVGAEESDSTKLARLTAYNEAFPSKSFIGKAIEGMDVETAFVSGAVMATGFNTLSSVVVEDLAGTGLVTGAMVLLGGGAYAYTKLKGKGSFNTEDPDEDSMD